MTPISNDQLLAALQWRYATKQFDPVRKIADADWAALERALILTPSSYGTQPYRFIVITDPVLKAALVPHSWGQTQPRDCSHFVVFARKLAYTEADATAYMALTAQTRGLPVEALDGFKKMLVGDLVRGSRSAVIPDWAALQAYIALGNFMTCAALLGIDTCPMEGIVPAEYDKLLGLEGTGYGASVACATGYRAASDKYAALAKVRFPAEQLIVRK